MSKEVTGEMPLRAQRPAPPPPTSGRQQSKKINLNTKFHNISSNDLNNNKQSAIFSWPTVIRPSAGKTTTNTTTSITSKSVKKKPPPRPAPPKNYQGPKKAGDALASPPPDLLADLADVFGAPPPKGSQPQSSSYPFRQSSHPNLFASVSKTASHQSSFTTSSHQPSFAIRPGKKYPAPVPSRNGANGEMSLIDFDTPIGTAHLTPSDTLALATAVNQHKSLIDWDMDQVKPSSQASKMPAVDLLTGNSLLNNQASVQNMARMFQSPAAGYVQHQAANYGAQHKEAIVSFGVKSVKEQMLAAREFSPPEPKFPPPPPPPGAEAEEEEEEEWQCAPVLEVCEVLFDFTAENPGDLSLRVGDRVEVEVKQNKDWWTGRCNGRRGIFPASFVQPENGKQLEETSAGASGSGCFAKALYDFSAEQATDLSFQEGDTVQVLYRINEDWLFGRCKGQEGQFPASFVTKINGAPSQEVCRVLFAFRAENSDDLTLNEGDRVLILEKSSADWWRGCLEHDPGKVGNFPASFVELCS